MQIHAVSCFILVLSCLDTGTITLHVRASFYIINNSGRSLQHAKSLTKQPAWLTHCQVSKLKNPASQGLLTKIRTIDVLQISWYIKFQWVNLVKKKHWKKLKAWSQPSTLLLPLPPIVSQKIRVLNINRNIENKLPFNSIWVHLHLIRY